MDLIYPYGDAYNYKIIMMSAIVDGLKESLSNIKAFIYDKKVDAIKNVVWYVLFA